MTTGDPPQQKTSQGNEKKKEDENITQGDPPKQKRSQGNEKKTEDDNITQVNVTLEAFEKYALREWSGRWKRNIWVHCEDEDKVPLWKTPLIKYYTHQANVANRKDSAMKKQKFHGMSSCIGRDAGRSAKLHAMMMKRDQVGKQAGAVLVLQLTKAAQLVTVKGASNAALRIAIAKNAETLCYMLNLN
ncbi:Protein ULTRAPETALA 2 [Glycine soja]|uniref:Protein ULTRAPETALA 2 n=1 Tax=Glycine soja TaxID=3848 RepID=A0A0B2RII9_GLYSO|nr:Protein ULTRAPETALA 2 [Glycine soja]